MAMYADRKKLEQFLFNNPQATAVLSKPKALSSSSGPMNAMTVARNHAENKAMEVDVNSEFSKLFFDLDIAVEMIIGMMLSPRGAVNPEIIFGSTYSKLPPTVIAAITKKLPQYFNDTYKLTVGLSKLLRKVLYEDGAVIKLIIPEAILDKLLRLNESITTEALSIATNDKIPLKGFMSNADVTKLTTESMSGHLTYYGKSPTLAEYNLTITDNYELLNVPAIRQYMRKRNANTILNTYTTTVESEWSMYSDRIDLSDITPDRESLGVPLYMEVESAAITPIPMPNDPTKHSGYLLLLDEHGHIISPNKIRHEIQQMYTALPTTPMGKSLVNTANPTTSVPNNTQASELLSHDLVKLFMQIVNSKINSLLSNAGNIHDLSSIEVNSMYSAILARAMRKQHTRLLFVPTEMVAYYAFKYNKNGTGVTMLSDLPALSTMRASLMFSGLVSEVKNNIPQTKVNISIDSKDTDPDSTIEMIMSNTLERQANLSPSGQVFSITDWSAWAYRAGYSFQVEQHPLLPDTKVEYEDVTPNRPVPSDSPLAKDIRALQLYALGTSAEMIDSSFEGNFATTDAARRIQLARRVAIRQSELCEMLTDEIRKLSRADGNVIKLIQEYLESVDDLVSMLPPEYKVVYKSNKKLVIKKLTAEIIESITTSLPTPETESVDDIFNSLQKYSATLDAALPSWINADMLGNSEEEEKLKRHLPQIIASVKAYYMRQFMMKNGYLPQLSEITEIGEDGTSNINLESIMASHIHGLYLMAKDYLSKIDDTTEGQIDGSEDNNMPKESTGESSSDDGVPVDDESTALDLDSGDQVGIDTPPPSDSEVTNVVDKQVAKPNRRKLVTNETLDQMADPSNKPKGNK